MPKFNDHLTCAVINERLQAASSTIALCIDIGGTLMKVARVHNNEMTLLTFATDRIQDLWTYIDKAEVLIEGRIVRITGGGAVRYLPVLEEELLVKRKASALERVDEMGAAVVGLNTIIETHRAQLDQTLEGDSPKEGFITSYDMAQRSAVPVTGFPDDEMVYPFLLVNIGSGVSMIKVDDFNTYQRITGTCLGGGTALGIAHVCSGVTDFTELLELSAGGTPWLDLTVAELQGDAAGQFEHTSREDHLPTEAIASAFGRLYTMGNLGDDTMSLGSVDHGDAKRTESSENPMRSFDTRLTPMEWSDESSDEGVSPNESLSGEPYLDSMQYQKDIAYSTVKMISYNLGYLAYLVSGITKTTRIFFTGKFVAAHHLTLDSLTYALDFCNKNYNVVQESSPPQAYFCSQYDGHIGAIGCFIAPKIES